ncbi:hypothetical protein GCM10027174_09810 [Salinifilum aidingensis]
MRIYVPFGTEWFGYLMRRLAPTSPFSSGHSSAGPERHSRREKIMSLAENPNWSTEEHPATEDETILPSEALDDENRLVRGYN